MLEPNNNDESVKVLKELFPNFPEVDLVKLLEVSNGNLQVAVESVLAYEHSQKLKLEPQRTSSVDSLRSLSTVDSECIDSASDEENSKKKQSSDGPFPIYLNVYDLVTRGSLMESLTTRFGLGLYHTGVEIFGFEYAFGGTLDENEKELSGVFTCVPQAGYPDFRERIYLGQTFLGSKQIHDILYAFKVTWTRGCYHILSCNCNHFCEMLISKLNPELSFPTWINRAARWGDRVVPEGVLKFFMEMMEDRVKQLELNNPKVKNNQSGESKVNDENDRPQSPRKSQGDIRILSDADRIELSEKVSVITGIIPGLETPHILNKLQEHEGQVEKTIDALLCEVCSSP